MALASGAFSADSNDISSTALTLANPFNQMRSYAAALSGPASRRKQGRASSILLQRKLEPKPTLRVVGGKCQEFLRSPLTPGRLLEWET